MTSQGPVVDGDRAITRADRAALGVKAAAKAAAESEGQRLGSRLGQAAWVTRPCQKPMHPRMATDFRQCPRRRLLLLQRARMQDSSNKPMRPLFLMTRLVLMTTLLVPTWRFANSLQDTQDLPRQFDREA